jgi:hypothetical protein
MRRSETPSSVRSLAGDPALPFTGSGGPEAGFMVAGRGRRLMRRPDELAVPPHRDPDVMCIDLGFW